METEAEKKIHEATLEYVLKVIPYLSDQGKQVLIDALDKMKEHQSHDKKTENP